MKDKKTQYSFKPLHSHNFDNVSEKKVLELLDKKQFEALKENKIYNVGQGTFKTE